MRKNFLTGAGLAAVMLIASSIGCGSGDMVGAAVDAANKNNVARVANVYGMFQVRNAKNGYMGPKDEAELKEFMRDPANSETIEKMGIEDVDAVFISERDDEPIKIRWGVQGSSRGCYEAVAFETTGTDSGRLVGSCNGTQEEIDDETTYNEMFDGNYKPETDRTEGGGIPKFDRNGNPIN